MYLKQHFNTYNIISKAKALCLVKNNTGRPSFNDSQPLHFDINPQAEVQVKLPIINLPTFNGSYDEKQSFSEGIQELIHQNNSLSDIRKFY